MTDSPFLKRPHSEWVASNALAFALRDPFPVSPGHTLVITRSEAQDWFSATPDERLAILGLIDEVKAQLDSEFHPDGYNIGLNAGTAAGQTVMHLHVHVIPRYRGDMDDPRGGVRHVIPSKGNYLRRIDPLATGGLEDPFARHLSPLFRTAEEIAIVAAFVQESGLSHIERDLREAVERGAHARLLTGDYLDITQASALEMVLDWQRAWQPEVTPEPLTELASAALHVEPLSPGRIEARIIEVGALPLATQSFHPKSWRFESKNQGVAFVGSSNLSRSALTTGIEWNLRVDRDRDRPAYERIRDSFDTLWQRARVLDAEWVEAYARRARTQRPPPPPLPGESALEPLEQAPTPHDVQREALETLQRHRQTGRNRALVVLATGLGKTWLAAFDFANFSHAAKSARPTRVLFIAHRKELLTQAAHTFRVLLRDRAEPTRVGWCVGNQADLEGDLVLASVAKLARPAVLERLADRHFDYVVIDEVHHAAAASYRRILAALNPSFLLGLTATPERADDADVLGLFGGEIAYRADIPRGIQVGRLVPFHYFGVKDDIDYVNIPWRNRRFDPEALSSAAQTEARMQTLWRAWSAHPGARTLVFCCSTAHADFVSAWLRDPSRGLKVAAVYAATDSYDRDQALDRLTRGDLDAICSVDLLNEGVDLPLVDRIVMLRPTESAVVFLQQLGRGLRAAEGKHAVTVIDFVGNHRIFLERLKTLLSFGGATPTLTVRAMLESEVASTLPGGCSVDLELEAKALLGRLFRIGGADEVERAYRQLRLERGARPTAGEFERRGYPPGSLRARHGSWFGFVMSEGDLEPDAARAVDLAAEFLRELEVTAITRAYKMVTLQALIEAGALTTGLPLVETALRSHEILHRSPELFQELPETFRVDTLGASGIDEWLRYWRENPIDAWTRPGQNTRPWLEIEQGRLRVAITIPRELEDAFGELVQELVDYRLAQYRARRDAATANQEGFVCTVLWNQRDPILKLPGTAVTRTNVPRGEIDIRVEGGVWTFRFAKEYVNVAFPVGTSRNQLPDLLRRWFGPQAGRPGTRFHVRFYASPEGLWAEPVQSRVVPLVPRRAIAAYPNLRAAAGHGQEIELSDGDVDERDYVQLPLENARAPEELFAVRVSGTSMDGGNSPIRDGDWAVLRWARSASKEDLRGRVVLVAQRGEGSGEEYSLKRLVEQTGEWRFVSDNPSGPSWRADEGTIPIARLERAVEPEALAPQEGTVLSEVEAALAFGVEALPSQSRRMGGHLFVWVDREGVLEAPDRVKEPSLRPRAGETAYVLVRTPALGADLVRYLGVGRWDEAASAWRVPEVDYKTWRAWGRSREVSRSLREGAVSHAQRVVDTLLNLDEEARWIEHSNGQRARIVGRAKRGGLRIVGLGPDAFVERTVSLTDLAWVEAAAEDVRERGGLLDEARVNRLRYLEGTPKESTRWIDTGWAIAACRRRWGLLGGSSVSVP